MLLRHNSVVPAALLVVVVRRLASAPVFGAHILVRGWRRWQARGRRKHAVHLHVLRICESQAAHAVAPLGGRHARAPVDILGVARGMGRHRGTVGVLVRVERRFAIFLPMGVVVPAVRSGVALGIKSVVRRIGLRVSRAPLQAGRGHLRWGIMLCGSTHALCYASIGNGFGAIVKVLHDAVRGGVPGHGRWPRSRRTT
jgi:hypothetical protein